MESNSEVLDIPTHVCELNSNYILSFLLNQQCVQGSTQVLNLEKSLFDMLSFFVYFDFFALHEHQSSKQSLFIISLTTILIKRGQSFKNKGT